MAKYVGVTHVDSVTGIPGFKAPMKNGPSYPSIKGLNIEWADTSRWPIQHPDDFPVFYGTCDDDADLEDPGVIKVFEDIVDDDTGDVNTAFDQYTELLDLELKARLPSVVSARQFRLALADANLLDSVETEINNLTEPARSKALIEWEYCTEVDKGSPLIQKLYPKLNLTEDQVDDIFTAAAEIGPVDPEEDPTQEV